MQIKSAPIGNVILIPAIGDRANVFSLLNIPLPPKVGTSGVAEKRQWLFRLC